MSDIAGVLNSLRWENIAVEDWYRDAPDRLRSNIKYQWLAAVAPRLYPGYRKNPELATQVRTFVQSMDLGPKVEYEDAIIRQDNLSMRMFTSVEESPEYARKGYDEQQNLKRIWFLKMLGEDPEFQGLSEEERQAYYENLMLEIPTFESKLFTGEFIGGITQAVTGRAGGTPGFFHTMTRDKLEEQIYADPEGRRADILKATTNFIESGITGAASLVLGPLRWMTGEDTGLAAILRDATKERMWINSINPSNNFITGFVPSMAGYLAGMIASPVYGGFEKLLAGATTLAKGGTAVIKTTGLFGKVGTALGAKLPPLAYQISGGAVAGAVQGITDSLMTGEHWTSNLVQDATIGVALEIGGRFFNAIRLAKRAFRNLDTNVADIMKEFNNIGSGSVMSPEMRGIMEANPDMAQHMGFAAAVDKNGMLLDLMDTPRGVELEAEVIGLRAELTDTTIRILDKEGILLEEFTDAAESVRVAKARGFLDTREDLWTAWQENTKVQTPQEQLEAQPTIEMGVYSGVPEPARQVIVQTLRSADIHLGVDYRVDPRGDTNFVDGIFGVVRKHGVKKSASVLESWGIIFDTEPEVNRAAIQQLKAELEQVMPSSPYYIVNKNTGNLVELGEMPSHMWEHPDAARPVVANKVFTGNAQDVRDALTNLRKTYTNEKRATTVRSKARGMEVHQYADNQLVEMRVRVPTGAGTTEEVLLHFNSLKAAQEALTTGRNKGISGLAGHIFADQPALRKTFNRWLKSMKSTNPKAYNEEFLPFRYAQEMARQEGYYLGSINGRYVVQDVTLDTSIKTHQFDNITDTIRWLTENDPRQLSPDLAKGVSQGAMNEIAPDGMDNPFRDMDFEQVKAQRAFGLRDAIPMQIAPTQYVMQRFESLASVQAINKKYGFSPVKIYNTIQDMNRNLIQFYNNRNDFLKRIKRGVKKDESTALWRYMQGLDDISEAKIFQMNEDPWTKADIELEMTEAFGAGRTAELLEVATGLRTYFDELFSLGNMNWGTYVKHYLPHMYDKLDKMNINTSTRIDPNTFTDIPEADNLAFFELLREADPREVILNHDVFGLADTYTRLMGRKLFTRPVMKDLGNHIRYITKQMKSKGTTDMDYAMVINYIADIFGTIEGIHAPADEIFRYATTQSLQGVADAVNARFKTHFQMKDKADLISTAITLATGGQIAGRPYPVMRNLTQSLITGGSLIGNRWWMHGLDVVSADPTAAIRRMEELGVVDKGTLAIGGGIRQGKGVLNKLVHGGMMPFKFADAINRSIIYIGMEARFNSALIDFKARKIDKAKFMQRSGARLYGIPQFNEIANIYKHHKSLDTAVLAVRDRIANIAVERSQYLYNKFDQPQAYRSGVGRLFGQYVSWPTNFYNLVKERLMTDSLTIGEKAGFLLRLGTSLGAISTGMYMAGLNPNTYMPQNMIMISGGPYYQLLNNLLQAADGNREAARLFAKGITSLVPFAYEGESIMRAVQAIGDGDIYEALMHLASAPLRTDVYPRRKTVIDDVEKSIYEAIVTAVSTVSRPIEALSGNL